MDFYLVSASALIMLTGIFHCVDVYLHYYILAEKFKCKCLFFFFFKKLLFNFKINVKKKKDEMSKSVSCNTRCHKVNLDSTSVTNSRNLTEASYPWTPVLHIILPPMKMLWYKNVREEEHLKVFRILTFLQQ